MVPTATLFFKSPSPTRYLSPQEQASLPCGRMRNGCFRKTTLTAAMAARKPNFHYIPTLSRADDHWHGLRGYVQEHVARIVEKRAAKLGISLPVPPTDPATPPAELKFDIYAYICGLNNMVAGVREKLANYGWHRKQI